MFFIAFNGTNNFINFKPEFSFGDIFVAVGIVIAATGLFYTAKQIKADRKSRELSTLEAVFKDIQSLSKDLEEYKEKTNERKSLWDHRFFNQLEWFAFLVNHKKITDQELIEFFKDSIIEWYEELFLTHYGEETIKDENQFEELKKLYKKLKE